MPKFKPEDFKDTVRLKEKDLGPTVVSDIQFDLDAFQRTGEIYLEVHDGTRQKAISCFSPAGARELAEVLIAAADYVEGS